MGLAKQGSAVHHAATFDILRSLPWIVFLYVGMAAVGGLVFGIEISIISGAKDAFKVREAKQPCVASGKVSPT